MVNIKDFVAKAPKKLRDFKIILEPIFLPEEQDNARIERLAKQILNCIRRSKSEGATDRGNTNFTDEIFGQNYDKALGLT